MLTPHVHVVIPCGPVQVGGETLCTRPDRQDGQGPTMTTDNERNVGTGSTRGTEVVTDERGPTQGPRSSLDNSESSQALAANSGHEAVGSDPPFDPLLTIDQVAQWLGKPKGTLYQWRCRKMGPRGIKVGNDVRYRRSEVEAFLDAHTERRSTA